MAYSADRSPRLFLLLLMLSLSASCMSMATRPAVTPEPPGWMGAGGGPTRDYADDTELTFPLGVRWRVDIGRGITSPPASSAGQVYLGGVDRKLTALALDDGGREWTNPYRAGFSAGVVAGERYLYAVTDEPEGIIRCLSTRNGALYWEAFIGPTVASPYVHGDLVLVVNGRGLLKALSRGEGKTVWERAMGEPVLSSPLVTDDAALVCTLGGELHSLGVATGDELWRVDVARGVEGDLAASDSLVFVPSLSFGLEARAVIGGGCVWRREFPEGCSAVSAGGDEVVGLGPDGTLMTLRAHDGSVVWQRRLTGVFKGSMALTTGAILVGGVDGRLGFYGRSKGDLMYSWEAGEPLIVPPVVVDGGVLVAGSLGDVTLLSAVASAEAGPASSLEDVFASPPEEPSTGAEAGGRKKDAPRSLVLHSVPFGARVEVGGSELGVTPLPVELAPLHGDTLLLNHPGFQPLALPVDSLARVPPPWRFELTPIGKGGAASAVERDARRDRRLAQVSFLGAILAGSGAIYCNHRGDEEFDRYRATGRLGAMREHFKRAEKWDRLSLLSWGVSQVAVAVGVYFVMRYDKKANRPAPADEGWGRNQE